MRGSSLLVELWEDPPYWWSCKSIFLIGGV